MAFHLQNIYGTEQDRVNCPFYYKIGACTFGERCARLHNKPTESQTILLANIYHTPYNQYGANSEPLFNVNDARSHLDDFYEDLFVEMEQFGEIEEIYVCRNLGDHLVGNVYVKFYEEDDASKALDGLRGRYYAGRPVCVELSPVTDFREARCRQYDVGECNRGGFCNFMHLGEPSRETQDKLYSWQRKVQRRKRLLKKKEEKLQRELEQQEREKEREKEREEAEKRRAERSSRSSRWDRQAPSVKEESGEKGRRDRDDIKEEPREKREDRDGGRERDRDSGRDREKGRRDRDDIKEEPRETKKKREDDIHDQSREYDQPQPQEYDQPQPQEYDQPQPQPQEYDQPQPPQETNEFNIKQEKEQFSFQNREDEQQ